MAMIDNASKRDGGPAFSVMWHIDGELVAVPGMTLRDYFAAKVAQAYCTVLPLEDQPPEQIAECAYRQADAMLAERRRNGISTAVHIATGAMERDAKRAKESAAHPHGTCQIHGLPKVRFATERTKGEWSVATNGAWCAACEKERGDREKERAEKADARILELAHRLAEVKEDALELSTKRRASDAKVAKLQAHIRELESAPRSPSLADVCKSHAIATVHTPHGAMCAVCEREAWERERDKADMLRKDRDSGREALSKLADERHALRARLSRIESAVEEAST